MVASTLTGVALIGNGLALVLPNDIGRAALCYVARHYMSGINRPSVALRALDAGHDAPLMRDGLFGLGRWRCISRKGTAASPDDLADTVVFLASDLSRAITGVNIHVDGGTSAASGFINWRGGGYRPVPLGDSLKLLFPRK